MAADYPKTHIRHFLKKHWTHEYAVWCKCSRVNCWEPQASGKSVPCFLSVYVSLPFSLAHTDTFSFIAAQKEFFFFFAIGLYAPWVYSKRCQHSAISVFLHPSNCPHSKIIFVFRRGKITLYPMMYFCWTCFMGFVCLYRIVALLKFLSFERVGRGLFLITWVKPNRVRFRAYPLRMPVFAL